MRNRISGICLFVALHGVLVAYSQREPQPSHTPSNEQLAQIKRKYGMFIHFGINTFCDEEWTDGTRPPSTYRPPIIDADQWIATAKAAGMKYVILVTKHEDGFCLWDSRYTDYDVGSSGNRTNVVEAVARACRKYGMDKNSPAIYNSIPGLTFLKNDSVSDKIGVYRLGGSYTGYFLRLDSTMHFRIIDFQCIGGGKILDSGVWFVYKTGRIGLKSKNGLQTFDLIKFRHFYFCIPPDKRIGFVDYFLRSPATSKEDETAYVLMDDYYLRDLNKPWR